MPCGTPPSSAFPRRPSSCTLPGSAAAARLPLRRLSSRRSTRSAGTAAHAAGREPSSMLSRRSLVWHRADRANQRASASSSCWRGQQHSSRHCLSVALLLPPHAHPTLGCTSPWRTLSAAHRVCKALSCDQDAGSVPPSWFEDRSTAVRLASAAHSSGSVPAGGGTSAGVLEQGRAAGRSRVLPRVQTWDASCPLTAAASVPQSALDL